MRYPETLIKSIKNYLEISKINDNNGMGEFPLFKNLINLAKSHDLSEIELLQVVNDVIKQNK